MIVLGTTKADIERAAGLLRAGELVAFPTETVYGLGADAANADAVAAIFDAKGRPADHPVIVHLPDATAMDAWGTAVPEAAWRLAEAFWPGPLTLVVRRAGNVADVITGGQDTVGLRVPGHPVARALLEAFGGALAAPSANRFGRISPTTAGHVAGEFDSNVAAVVDGGPCDVGVESTIVDLSGEYPRLLRPGMIGVDAIESVLQTRLEQPGDTDGPRASGRLPTHYAPETPLELVDAGALDSRVAACTERDMPVVVLARRSEPAGFAGGRWIEMPADPAGYARSLYAQLRAADAAKPVRLIVEAPPAGPGWSAVIDRLRRAAAAQTTDAS